MKDTAVQKIARAHHSTVTKVSKGEVKMPRRPRRKPENKNSDVITVKVDHRVWEKAMNLAGGDPSRIQVFTTTKVLVHNSGNWRFLMDKPVARRSSPLDKAYESAMEKRLKEAFSPAR